MRVIANRFQTRKLTYLSSRTYGGYATTGLNPEPYAYESAFSVKWLIEQQIDGDKSLNFDPARGEVKASVAELGTVSLGQRLDETRRRLLLRAGRLHSQRRYAPIAVRQRKVGQLLLKFFESDSTTKPWFKQP